ncbi:MAG TPA: AbrB family transcriptional regulator [Acetobacteraceae bacterium]|nr:AbrB family transcriptional regulator [Acetobacteraceae bacterium]
MDSSPEHRAVSLQWAILIILSGIFAVGLETVRLPAALLLGPMIAAITVAVAGGGVRVPHHPVLIAQAVIGCMIARSIPPAIIGDIIRDWPLFVAVVTAVIVASSTLGWLLTRWRMLPGTTVVWGSSPGAATAMMLMAAAYGADIRLVAFMQYLRVLLVAIVATLVSRLWTAGATGPAAAMIWFPSIAWAPFAETLALIGIGAASARLRGIPAAPLLVPLGVGMALQDAGYLTIELPPWLLAISYTVVGWSIGLDFNRTILAHAAQALPRVVMSILVLMAVCGGLAALLVVAAGIDPLTAYLATSPGGADSAAIIAMASNVDVAFVMAMQTTRLVLVLLIGPAAWRASSLGGRAPRSEHRKRAADPAHAIGWLRTNPPGSAPVATPLR